MVTQCNQIVPQSVDFSVIRNQFMMVERAVTQDSPAVYFSFLFFSVQKCTCCVTVVTLHWMQVWTRLFPLRAATTWSEMEQLLALSSHDYVGQENVAWSKWEGGAAAAPVKSWTRQLAFSYWWFIHVHTFHQSCGPDCKKLQYSEITQHF